MPTVTMPEELVREIRDEVGSLLAGAWREPGLCVPNGDTYPHQWLWDSCFHAVAWYALGDERGVVEMTNVLARQEPSGFVPHMTYWHHPDLHRDFWGRSGTSIITQPPMYGHAARVLFDRDGGTEGSSLPDDLSERIAKALSHLYLDRPRTPKGLVPVLHPWETGCDDSPRWDGHRHRREPWRTTKGELVAALRGNAAPGRRFVVGSIGFNALLVWNTREYLRLPNARRRSELSTAADDLAAAIADRWDHDAATWVDDVDPASDPADHDDGSASRIRTADTMAALLVDPRPEGFDQLGAPDAFAAPYGPRGVHRAEPTYRPDVYWRGPAWPQISYLLWRAALEAGREHLAVTLARSLVHGARRSGWAEYWHPESGLGLGARPQTWAGLALPAARWLSDTSTGTASRS